MTAALVDAAKTICVPYVVDARPIDALVRRPGIAKHVGHTYHGVEVTSYIVDAPGHPEVAALAAKDLGIDPDGHHEVTSPSCGIGFDGSPDVARQVVQRFRDTFSLTGYRTTPPHDVLMAEVVRGPNDPIQVACVHGRQVALVNVSATSMQPLSEQFAVYVKVDSNPVMTESEGCIPAPR